MGTMDNADTEMLGDNSIDEGCGLVIKFAAAPLYELDSWCRPIADMEYMARIWQ